MTNQLFPLRPLQQSALDSVKSSLRADFIERWLPVVGYENLYEVSDLGRVRSVDRIVCQANRWGSLSNRHLRGKVLSPAKNSHGYLVVALGNRGQTTMSVHILVLSAFIGPRPRGKEGAHGDGNPSNNRLSNLRYASPVENSADSRLHGTHLFGERAPWAKVSEETARAIRESSRSLTLKYLSEKYEISFAQISKIRNGRQWVHLGGATNV